MRTPGFSPSAVARAGPAEETGADEDAGRLACDGAEEAGVLAAAGDGDDAVVAAPPGPKPQAVSSAAAASTISVRLAIELIVVLNMAMSFHEADILASLSEQAALRPPAPERRSFREPCNRPARCDSERSCRGRRPRNHD